MQCSMVPLFECQEGHGEGEGEHHEGSDKYHRDGERTLDAQACSQTRQYSTVLRVNDLFVGRIQQIAGVSKGTIAFRDSLCRTPCGRAQ